MSSSIVAPMEKDTGSREMLAWAIVAYQLLILRLLGINL